MTVVPPRTQALLQAVEQATTAQERAAEMFEEARRLQSLTNLKIGAVLLEVAALLQEV